MRASISTIGPPYGTVAPPPRSILAQGLIHAPTLRFTASSTALGSTVLIRSGPFFLVVVDKGRLSSLTHTRIFWRTPWHGLALKCVWSWAGDRGVTLGDLRFGQCSHLVLGYICYRRFSLKKESVSGFFSLYVLWSITQLLFFSSVPAAAWRSAAPWSGPSVVCQSAFSSPTPVFPLLFLKFFLKKCTETSKTGLKCSGSRSIWYEKWAD